MLSYNYSYFFHLLLIVKLLGKNNDNLFIITTIYKQDGQTYSETTIPTFQTAVHTFCL